jgi:3-oxoacyl-[acyl-carrier protein] reductase
MIDVSLAGQAIVVTGAGGRLGSRLVQRFAGAGAAIAAVVRHEEDVAAIPFPEDAEGWAFTTDTADEAMVSACFQQIGAQFGRIDALFPAVGGWESRPFVETSLEDWDAMMRRNLTSTFLCFREALRLMTGASGRLVAFASGQGADGGRTGQAAYAASKAGVLRLVEAVAAETRGTGITVHAIAPSTILFEPNSGEAGVDAEHLLDLCHFLCLPAAAGVSGTLIRAFGTA